MHLFRRTLLIMILLSILPNAYAEMRDPTFPEGFVAQTSVNIDQLNLSAILISKDRKVAVINDEPLTIGEVILGYKIVDIYTNLVVLDGPQGRITIYLLNQSPVRQESIRQG